jgi:hypothetical protein
MVLSDIYLVLNKYSDNGMIYKRLIYVNKK